MDTKGRIMALDYGAKRIGVAISDELRIIAKPHCIINSARQILDFDSIRRLIAEQQISTLLVGLPTGGAGEVGTQARNVIRWSRKLAAYVNVPTYFWDESYSTVSAAGHKSANRRHGSKYDDALAAAYFLQEYLDALSSSVEEPGKSLESYAQFT